MNRRLRRLIRGGAQPRPSVCMSFPVGVRTVFGSCFVWEGQASISVACHISLSKQSMVIQTRHNNNDTIVFLAKFDISDVFHSDERLN